MLPDGVGTLREGPRFEVTVGPGMVRVGARDWRAADATDERETRRRDDAGTEDFPRWSCHSPMCARDPGSCGRGRCSGRYVAGHAVGLSARGVRAQDALSGEYDADALLASVGAGLVNGRNVAGALDQLYALTGTVDREKLAEKVSEWLDDARQGSALALELADVLSRLEEPSPWGRIIRLWSRASRARMILRICSLDFAPMLADRNRVPVMVTATYPGDWLTVAPDGRTCNRQHWDALRKRYARAWDEPALAVWKREFQARGAPHFHAHMVPPVAPVEFAVNARTWALLTDPDDDTARLLGLRLGEPLDTGGGTVRSVFRGWLSVSWAEIVDHPDDDEYRRHMRAGTGVDVAEGLRATDPKRLGVYFLKHGLAAGKEYQNEPPDEWPEDRSVGRFWGVWGLETATATVTVTPDDAAVVARTLRRMSHAQRRYVARTRPRVRGGKVHGRNDHDVLGVAGADRVDQDRVRYRRTKVRAVALAHGRGWVSLNDGPAVAARIGQWLTTDAPPRPPTVAECRQDRTTLAVRLAELHDARLRRALT